MSNATGPLSLDYLSSKDFRDEFMSAMVRGTICYQLQALREQRSMTQAEFAAAIGKSQTVVSRLESVERSRATVQTLLDIANALDIALQVRFVDFPTFLDSNRDVSPRALEVDSYDASQRATRHEAPTGLAPYPPKRMTADKVTTATAGGVTQSHVSSTTNIIEFSLPEKRLVRQHFSGNTPVQISWETEEAALA